MRILLLLLITAVACEARAQAPAQPAPNPGAPGFRRSLSRTQVGAITLHIDSRSRDLLLRGIVEGSAVDIPFRSFRWTRNAWSRGN